MRIMEALVGLMLMGLSVALSVTIPDWERTLFCPLCVLLSACGFVCVVRR